MGFLDRIQADAGKRYPRSANPREGPQPPGRFSFGTQLQGGPRYTDPFGARPGPSLPQLVENYSALVYAMVNRNANAVARVPMRLLADGSRAQGKPNRACDAIKVSRAVGRQLAASGKISSAAVDQVYEVRNHPLLDALDTPDPYGTFTREKLIATICAYMDVVGDGYLVPEGNGWDWTDKTDRIKGPPENLWMLYSQYTIPIRLMSSPIVDYYQYFADAIPLNATLRFRHTHSLRDVYGASFGPTYAGEAYRRQEQEQVAILSQVLGLGPRPNMIASSKDSLVPVGEKERSAFEKDLIRKHSAGYAGGVLVTSGAFDFTPMSYSPADLAGKEISEYDLYNLAAIFGQPATYYTVDSNLANLQAADAQHARNGVQPRCNTIAGTFTQLAKQCDPRLVCAFDPVLPEDELTRAQTDKIYVDMGAITINQLNEEKKYPAVAWGDEPWLSSSLKQPSMIVQAHEQSMEQQKQALESGATKDELAVDGHEHQKEMDKAQLAQDAKDRESRVLDTVEALTRDIADELDVIRKGNPNHVPSGPHGGEFASGGGGSAPSTKKLRKKKEKPNRKHLTKAKAGGGGGKGKTQKHKMSASEKADRVKKGKPLEYVSEKAERAAINQNKTDGKIQEYTKANEHVFAKRMGGKSFPDNDPIDVSVDIKGKEHGIELKTITHGKNDKITMKDSAIERKVAWEKEHGTQMHTVALDHRDKGIGGTPEMHSGHEIYYKRGVGSFRIGTMHKVANEAELKTLMATPYDKLPKAAQGPIRGVKS